MGLSTTVTPKVFNTNETKDGKEAKFVPKESLFDQVRQAYSESKKVLNSPEFESEKTSWEGDNTVSTNMQNILISKLIEKRALIFNLVNSENVVYQETAL